MTQINNLMLDNLKLNIPEGQYIDLTQLNFDWEKFNIACVNYYKKWEHITNQVELKTWIPDDPVAEQVKNFYKNYNFNLNSSDIFPLITKAANYQTILDSRTPTKNDFNSYNSDLIDEFSIIPETINMIESFTGLKLRHLKLRYVKENYAEFIHVDDCNVVYHMPIVTNNSVFFVSNDKIFHMRNINKMYALDTQTPHTVVNASGTLGRLHLIMFEKFNNYEFLKENTSSNLKQLIEICTETLQNVSQADAILNKDIYKYAKINLHKLKKLNNL